MNNNKWIFDDGAEKHECTSFPYAFRMMFNAMKKGVETGKKSKDMEAKFKIISPLKKVYYYSDAAELAADQGLLTPDGQINGKEFKRK